MSPRSPLASPSVCIGAQAIDRFLVDASRALRVRRASTDIDFFLETYIYDDDIVRSHCELHDDFKDIWQRIIDSTRLDEIERCIRLNIAVPPGIREARAAPRGHSKTTWTQWMILHLSLYRWKRYMINQQRSDDLASQNIDGIRNLLESPKITADFGDLIQPTRSSMHRLVLANGVRIDGVGMQTAVRGRRHFRKRPDLELIDDPQKNADVESDTIRAKHKRRLDEELLKGLDPHYGDVVFVGTNLHRDSLMTYALRKPGWRVRGTARVGEGGPLVYQAVKAWATRQDLWETWRRIYTNLENPDAAMDAYRMYLEHEQEMLLGAEVLWPEYVSYYHLMCEYVTLGRVAFMRENQNIPLASEDQLFDTTRFTWLDWRDVNLGDYPEVVGFWDPSVGVEDAAANVRGVRDWAAYVVVGAHRLGYRDIFDVRLLKGEIEDQVRTWWGVDQQWWPDRFGVETVGFAQVILPLHRRMLADENRERAGRGEDPYRGPRWEKRPAWHNKVARVLRLQAPLHNGHIRLVRNPGNPDLQHFVAQWDTFPTPHELDGPDATEGAIRMLEPRRKALEDWATTKGPEPAPGEPPATPVDYAEPQDVRAAAEGPPELVAADPMAGPDDLLEAQRREVDRMIRQTYQRAGRFPTGMSGEYRPWRPS